VSGFDTPIHAYFIGGWLVFVILATAWGFVRFAEVIGWRYRAFMALLRLLAGLVVLLVLLQPYTETRTPDKEGFRVAVLADASHSMSVRDVKTDLPRVKVVQKAFDRKGKEGLLRRLEQQYRLTPYVFTDQLRAVAPKMASGEGVRHVLPGRTAIGDVLSDCLREAHGTRLGGVLLLSDGHSNSGISVSEAGKLFRSRGIPVSCVGIGELVRAGDVRIRFTQETFAGIKGNPLTLTALLTNTFPAPVTVQLQLTERGMALEQRAVTLLPDEPVEVEFRPTPWAAGLQIYGLGFTPVPGDRSRDNDADFAMAKVREPDVFRLLFLGAHLNWEYRFLKILCDESKQLQLAAVIKTGPQNYYKTGFPEHLRNVGKGFPVRDDTFNHFDALLLDTRALAFFSTEVLDRLAGFVEHRGGGLLAFGPLDHLAERVADLLPVRVTEPTAPVRDIRFDVSKQFIFGKDATGALRSPRGFLLAAGEPLWLGKDTKIGARAAAGLRGNAMPVLTAQSYGSGRVAYISFENSWKWRLGDAAGQTAHSAFWEKLLVWLSSTGKQRIRAACDGAKVAIGEEVALDVDVLGRDFRAAPDARISATITSASGKQTDLHLDPTGAAPGRYTALFFPEESGVYTVGYQVETSGDKVEHSSHFLARQTGLEAENTAYLESILRDLARITEGTFWHYSEIGAISKIPLSKDIPVRIHRRYWCRSWFPFLLLVIFLATEWYLRRRIGLK